MVESKSGRVRVPQQALWREIHHQLHSAGQSFSICGDWLGTVFLSICRPTCELVLYPPLTMARVSRIFNWFGHTLHTHTLTHALSTHTLRMHTHTRSHSHTLTHTHKHTLSYTCTHMMAADIVPMTSVSEARSPPPPPITPTQPVKAVSQGIVFNVLFVPQPAAVTGQESSESSAGTH